MARFRGSFEGTVEDMDSWGGVYDVKVPVTWEYTTVSDILTVNIGNEQYLFGQQKALTLLRALKEWDASG